jgi:succinoglycan biosynthesis protein ExoW
MTSIGVVIPYYQREPGLLARAVRSILAQDAPDVRFTIVVVDDGSPRPAALDLADVTVEPDNALVTVAIANGGPGSARNAGLDVLAEHGVDLVALLDSDDWWTKGHIADALACLGDDADLYFDDHDREQYPGETSYFAAHGRLARWLAPDGPLVVAGQGMLACRPAALTSFLLMDFPAQSSTVVFRQRGRLADIRFDPKLRSLGEDLLFFLELARAARAVHLSTAIGAHCGAGVSIFHSALSWDHPDAPMRFANSLLLWSLVDRRFTLRPDERRLVRQRIKGFRRGYLFMALRFLARRHHFHHASLALLRRHGLWSWADVPRATAGLVARRVIGRTPFPEH